jgi:hypothetical protein
MCSCAHVQCIFLLDGSPLKTRFRALVCGTTFSGWWQTDPCFIQIREGAKLDLGECLKMEKRMACRFMVCRDLYDFLLRNSVAFWALTHPTCVPLHHVELGTHLCDGFQMLF